MWLKLLLIVVIIIVLIVGLYLKYITIPEKEFLKSLEPIYDEMDSLENMKFMEFENNKLIFIYDPIKEKIIGKKEIKKVLYEFLKKIDASILLYKNLTQYSQFYLESDMNNLIQIKKKLRIKLFRMGEDVSKVVID